ncbi:DivIVA domain-containing protein [Desulfosporosinus lacus]|uniref:Cell division initiation protein n=1 Tax=Desulfosporosinus lacus DSM 15449 TaxID=1121420 RepID=A0A1M5WBF9_9FIRM|nr:DivIVA domain-containing protein [Desulfosporosinus lacus]SHH84534.1 cell division initiation protein [Desulfosporosinus lacus DSM 15449]
METPEFKRGFRGYDSDAVDQAWAESERQLSEANAANKELRLQINSLREQNSEWGNRLKYYEQIEKDLRDALVSAQRIANQVKDEATIQAEELLQSARSESEVILSEAARLSESKEIEADNMLIEKRMEIVQLEEQIQGLIEQKTELQTLVDQVRQYLEKIKDLII